MLLVLKTFLQRPPNKTECFWASAADQGWAEGGGRGLFVMMVCEAWNIPNWMLMCLLVCLSKQATDNVPSVPAPAYNGHVDNNTCLCSPGQASIVTRRSTLDMVTERWRTFLMLNDKIICCLGWWHKQTGTSNTCSSVTVTIDNTLERIIYSISSSALHPCHPPTYMSTQSIIKDKMCTNNK